MIHAQTYFIYILYYKQSADSVGGNVYEMKTLMSHEQFMNEHVLVRGKYMFVNNPLG